MSWARLSLGLLLMAAMVLLVRRERGSERALRQSETTLRMFIEHAPASLAMFDRDMRYLAVSRRWRTDYGLGERNITDVSHYDVFPEISAEWRRVHTRALHGEVLQAVADRFVRADGSVQWLRWETRPWRNASGEIGGIMIFTEDISELTRALDESRELTEWFRLARPQLAPELGNGI